MHSYAFICVLYPFDSFDLFSSLQTPSLPIAALSPPWHPRSPSKPPKASYEYDFRQWHSTFKKTKPWQTSKHNSSKLQRIAVKTAFGCEPSNSEQKRTDKAKTPFRPLPPGLNPGLFEQLSQRCMRCWFLIFLSDQPRADVPSPLFIWVTWLLWDETRSPWCAHGLTAENHRTDSAKTVCLPQFLERQWQCRKAVIQWIQCTYFFGSIYFHKMLSHPLHNHLAH